MHITAKVDYAVRTLVEIARVSAAPMAKVKAETIASAQKIPPKVLEAVLAELRRADLVTSRRGPDGGYRLARPAAEISIADVIRAVEGPLADVRGLRPEHLAFPGSATALRDVWLATRVSLRRVLEHVSIADVVAGEIPSDVAVMLEDPDALIPH